MVILIVQVQHAHHRLGTSARKAVAAKHVDLPEIIAGQIADVAVIALAIPERLAPREKSTAMLEDREEVYLVQRRLQALAETDRLCRRNFEQLILQFRLAQTVAHTERPFGADELVERDGHIALSVTQILRRAAGRRKSPVSIKRIAV